MFSRKKWAICVDLGATRLRVALCDEGGRILRKIEGKTSLESPRAISDQMISMAASLCEAVGASAADIKSIGIASIGPLDLRRGEVVGTPNLPFKRIPLVGPVRRRFRAPVYLLNDCTAGAIGEHEYGAGMGVDNFAYIALGTGIGGGVFVDGRPLLGKDGNAAEVGHMTIDSAGRLACGCGARGHWEAYCSGRNMPNFVRMRLGEMGEEAGGSALFELAGGDLRNLTAEALFEAAKRGDRVALELVEEVGKLNAMGFANVVNAYDPSLIIVGGAIALRNKKLVLGPLRRHLRDYAVNRLPKIVASPLGEDAGLRGAAAVALKPPEVLPAYR